MRKRIKVVRPQKVQGPNTRDILARELAKDNGWTLSRAYKHIKMMLQLKAVERTTITHIEDHTTV